MVNTESTPPEKADMTCLSPVISGVTIAEGMISIFL
jgi:hypothetical protein